MSVVKKATVAISLAFVWAIGIAGWSKTFSVKPDPRVVELLIVVNSLEIREGYTILHKEWHESVESLRSPESFKALIAGFIATESNDSRRLIHDAISLAIGHDKAAHDYSRAALQKVTLEKDRQIRSVAIYLLKEALPYEGLSDNANQRRLKDIDCEIEAIRWLAVANLSYAMRDFVIDTHPEIVFSECRTSLPAVILQLQRRLEVDPSPAVRAASVEAIDWYFLKGKVNVEDLRQVLRAVEGDSSPQVRYLFNSLTQSLGR